MSTSYSKAQLKAIKEHIGAKKYPEAKAACERLLQFEPGQYTANIFLGVACQNLGEEEECAEAYERAVELDAEKPLAWQGLASLYERTGKVDKLLECLDRLANLFHQKKNGPSLLSTLEKMIKTHKEQGNMERWIDVKLSLLPSSVSYPVLEGTEGLPTPVDIWLEIIEAQEKADESRIVKEIEARRRRLGAGTMEEIRHTAHGIVYMDSKLEQYYQGLLKDTDLDEEKKVETLVKYLARLEGKLPYLSEESEKSQMRGLILETSKELVEREAPHASVYSLLLDLHNGSIETYPLEWVRAWLDLSSSDAPGYTLYQSYLAWREWDKQGDSPITAELLQACHEEVGRVKGMIMPLHFLSFISLSEKTDGEGVRVVTQCALRALDSKVQLGWSLDHVYFSLQINLAKGLILLNKFLEAKEALDTLSSYAQDHLTSNREYIMTMAIILTCLEQEEEALSLLDSLIKKNPEDHQALFERALCHHRMKTPQKDEEDLVQAIQLSPDTAKYYQRLGEFLWEKNRPEEALPHLMTSCRKDPSSSRSFLYLGHYYRQVKKDEARAFKCYQRSYSLNPREVEGVDWLTQTFLCRGEILAAAGILDQHIRTSPTPPPIWALSRMGFISLGQGECLEAISYFQSALKRSPNSIPIWEGLGEAYAREGRYMASLRVGKRILQLDPGNPHALYRLGEVYSRLRMYPEAYEALQSLSTMEVEGGRRLVHAARFILASTYLQEAQEIIMYGLSGQARVLAFRALDLILELLERDEETEGKEMIDGMGWGRAWSILGFLLEHHLGEKDEDKEEEEEEEERERGLEKDSLDRCLHLCTIHFSTNLSETPSSRVGRASLALAQAWTQSKEGSKDPDAHYALALTHHLTRVPGCDTALGQCLSLEPDHPQAWALLGLWKIQQGAQGGKDLALVQHCLVHSLDLDDKDAMVWSWYGIFCLMQGDIILGKRAFHQAQLTDPEGPLAWLGLALILDRWEGQGQEASSLYAHCLQLDTRNGTLAQVRYGMIGLTQAWEGMKEGGSRCLVDLEAQAFALRCCLEGRDMKEVLPGVWNLYGLLLEWMASQLAMKVETEGAGERERGKVFALLQRSGDAFTKGQRLALSHPDQGWVEPLSRNVARVLCSLGRAEEALVILESSGLNTEKGEILSVQSGLASFHAGDVSSALQGMQHVLESEEVSLDLQAIEVRADVVVLTSQILWALESPEYIDLAKDQLLNVLAQGPHIKAICTLCAMGLLLGDMDLASAALRELLSLPWHQSYELDYQGHVDHLYSLLFYLQAETELCIKVLEKSVHMFPHRALFWSRLARFTQSSKSAVAASILSKNAQNQARELIYASVFQHQLKDDQTEEEEDVQKEALVMARQKAAHLSPSILLNHGGCMQ